MSSLKVGTAKVCITPKNDMFPFPGWEGFHYEAVYDDCYCRAIVIDNGRDKCAIVGFDLSRPPVHERIKDAIADNCGIERSNILLIGTHSHTGLGGPGRSADPAVVEKMNGYIDSVVDNAVLAVKQALDNFRPARYGFGEGDSYINTNRDKLFEDGFWMQERNLAGFSDKTLAAIKFVDMEGGLIAAILNHATHATCAFCAKDADGKGKVSGNFPGITSRYIEERFGNDSVVVWTSGAAGNQNPVTNGGRHYDRDGFAESAEFPDGTAYILMEHIGQLHAVDAIGVLNGITRLSDSMPIFFLSGSVQLPAQKAPEGADMGYNRLLVDNLLKRRGLENPKSKKLVEMLDDPDNPVKLPLQLIVLGDIAMFGIAAEPYNEIGVMCKEASPLKKTMVITHFGDSVGYILDKSNKDKKVFQSFGRVKPGGADELIVDAMLDMFDEYIVKK